MKPLSKTSWLYRANMTFGTSDFKNQARYNSSVSLCTLVQSSVILLVMLSLISAGLFGCLFVAGVVIICVSTPIMLLLGFVPNGLDLGIFYCGLWPILLLTFCIGFGLWLDNVIDFAPKYMKFKNKSTKNSNTKLKYTIKDSYVYQYIKSHKDKFCPMIDIVDDKKPQY
jgi:hypothetical protein